MGRCIQHASLQGLLYRRDSMGSPRSLIFLSWYESTLMMSFEDYMLDWQAELEAGLKKK